MRRRPGWPALIQGQGRPTESTKNPKPTAAASADFLRPKPLPAQGPINMQAAPKLTKIGQLQVFMAYWASKSRATIANQRAASKGRAPKLRHPPSFALKGFRSVS